MQNLCGAAAVNELIIYKPLIEIGKADNVTTVVHEPEDLPRKSNRATDHCRLQKMKANAGYYQFLMIAFFMLYLLPQVLMILVKKGRV